MGDPTPAAGPAVLAGGRHPATAVPAPSGPPGPSGRAGAGRAVLAGCRRVVAAAGWLWFAIALVAVWWFASADSTSAYFPPLRTIVHRLYELWIVGDAKSQLAPSLEHFAAGYGIAGAGGIALGALLWGVRPLRESTSPLLYFCYVLPAPALLPAVITLFGIDTTMKVAIISFAAVWPTLLNTVDGMRGVDPVKLDTARALGLSPLRTAGSVVLPAALPQIVAGLRNSLQVAIILMVVSEMTASTSGIGYFILTAQQSLAITDMWTGIIVLAVLGSALNLVFVAAERFVLAWHYGARAAEGKRS
ncbi:MAG TPA: ABC transporter permease subunit [Mycobacteriales bacterium]|nr:ABC transporter permease subunit [Mycobacteriales bacterium]